MLTLNNDVRQPPTAIHAVPDSVLASEIGTNLTPQQAEKLLALLSKDKAFFDVHFPLQGYTYAMAHRIHTEWNFYRASSTISSFFRLIPNHQHPRYRHAETKHNPPLLKPLVVTCDFGTQERRVGAILSRLPCLEQNNPEGCITIVPNR